MNLVVGAGSYFLHVVDIHGCRLDTLVVLADVTPPNYSAISANPTCSDSENGMIQLNILDANVTVVWSQGAMGPVVSNLSSGNHPILTIKTSWICAYCAVVGRRYIC